MTTIMTSLSQIINIYNIGGFKIQHLQLESTWKDIETNGLYLKQQDKMNMSKKFEHYIRTVKEIAWFMIYPCENCTRIHHQSCMYHHGACVPNFCPIVHIINETRSKTTWKIPSLLIYKNQFHLYRCLHHEGKSKYKPLQDGLFEERWLFGCKQHFKLA